MFSPSYLLHGFLLSSRIPYTFAHVLTEATRPAKHNNDGGNPPAGVAASGVEGPMINNLDRDTDTTLEDVAWGVGLVKGCDADYVFAPQTRDGHIAEISWREKQLRSTFANDWNFQPLADGVTTYDPLILQFGWQNTTNGTNDMFTNIERIFEHSECSTLRLESDRWPYHLADWTYDSDSYSNSYSGVLFSYDENLSLGWVHSFMALTLELVASIASFGFYRLQQSARTSQSSFSWYWGLKFMTFVSTLMLPYTCALALVEILCSFPWRSDSIYFSRRTRGYVFTQYLLWFFTNRLANKILDNLSNLTRAEFERPVANRSALFNRGRMVFREVVRRSPLTSFSLASVLSAYLLYDAIDHFRNRSQPSVLDTEPDSILGLFLAPTCTFVLGFLVLHILSTMVKRCRQILPSYRRL